MTSAATSTRGTAPPPAALEGWAEQDWHTDAGAPGEDGTARCLPHVAWQLLTPAERRLAAIE